MKTYLPAVRAQGRNEDCASIEAITFRVFLAFTERREAYMYAGERQHSPDVSSSLVSSFLRLPAERLVGPSATDIAFDVAVRLWGAAAVCELFDLAMERKRNNEACEQSRSLRV